jgi:hypothetical protein
MQSAITRVMASTHAQRRIVYAALAVYAAAFALWWPNALLVSDEASYVGQAVLFAEGHATTVRWETDTETFSRGAVSTYPAGTSLLQTPFVFLGGWRAAPLASLFALLGTVLLLVLWLERAGRAPIFALLILLFPPAAVLGRVGMSDVPSALVVTAGWVLFWSGLRGARWAWLGAGFLAGAAVLWRESNALLFLPLFLGAVIRRERVVWQLVLGGVAGLCLRLGVSTAVFGSGVFARYPVAAFFSPDHFFSKLLVNVVLLLVMVPAGLLAPFLYRGERRPEIIATVLLFLGFYSLYYYDGSGSQSAMRLILGPRYFIPLVPLLAFCAAECFPRLAADIAGRWASAPRLAPIGAGVLALALLVQSIGVHPALYRWGAAQARMREAILSETPPGGIVILNSASAGKIASYAYGPRRFVPRELLKFDNVVQWSRAPEGVFVAFINRNDTDGRIEEATENERFEQTVRNRCTVKVLQDVQETWFEKLRILKVANCA